jgi:hypothetical protein
MAGQLGEQRKTYGRGSWRLLLAAVVLGIWAGSTAWAQSCTPLAPGTSTVPPGSYCLSVGQYNVTVVTSPPPGLQWVLLNAGTVPDGQFDQRGEIDATFDPTRNRVVTLDQYGRVWVYELSSGVNMRALNGGAPVVGPRRNCAVAYVPGLDAVFQGGCAPQYPLAGQSNGIPVFTFPDNNTVNVYFQCDNAECQTPGVSNFLAWHPGLHALVGAGGWSFSASRDKVAEYVFGSPPVLPPYNTPWTYLPQSGPAPNYDVCNICLESVRRTVLRAGKMVYVDPLTYNLYTYDFAPPAGQPTWTVTNTNKPGPIPQNGVIGYDQVQDKLVAWVGVDALYWSPGVLTFAQTWIYDFTSNTWTAGPSQANGDTTPFATIAIAPIFVWDSVGQRLLLITNDAMTSGYTRIWAVTWH